LWILLPVRQTREAMTMANPSFCTQCGGTLPGQARFCPGCGTPVGGTPRRALPPRAIAGIVGLAAILLAVGWGGQHYLAGERPKRQFAQAHAGGGGGELPESIKAAVDAAKSSPEDIGGWQRAATAITEELRRNEKPAPVVVFEALEVFGQILRLNPKDSTALIAMADLSFNQQVFDKATGYFERYLEIEGGDLAARSRYASSLSFLGRYDDAIGQLKNVLERDPANFHATAYLAITYAQMGNRADAITLGESALKLAPSDDARARFGQFLEEVKVKTSEPADKSPPTQAAAAKPGEDPVTTRVRASPIAGPKFVRSESDATTVRLFFREFPVEAMPPFAKDKFFGSLREAAQGTPFTEAHLIDVANGRTMEKVPLR